MNHNIEVRVLHGCPMVPMAEGQRLLEWMEHYQVYQDRKLAMVRSLLVDEPLVDHSKMDVDRP